MWRFFSRTTLLALTCLSLALVPLERVAAQEASGWSFSKEPVASLAYRLPKLKADAFRAICESDKIGPEIPVMLRLATGKHQDGASVDIGVQSEDFEATYAGTVSGKSGVELPIGIEDPLWKILQTEDRLSFRLSGLDATAIALKGAADATKSFLDVCRAQFAAADAAAPQGEMITETFVCEDGTTLRARFDNSRSYSVALISHNGDPEVPLIQVESGSGVRYSNGDYTLHTKANDALLSKGDDVLRCRAE